MAGGDLLWFFFYKGRGGGVIRGGGVEIEAPWRMSAGRGGNYICFLRAETPKPEGHVRVNWPCSSSGKC